jgi:hypothetical protein
MRPASITGAGLDACHNHQNGYSNYEGQQRMPEPLWSSGVAEASLGKSYTQ